MLMLICAQSGRVLGLERENDPDSNNRLLGIVIEFRIPFGTEIKISICGALDRDCTEVTLHRVANFRVKHLNSDIEQPVAV